MIKQINARWLSGEMVKIIFDKTADEISKQSFNINKVSRQSLQVLSTNKQQSAYLKDLSEQIVNLCIIIGGIPKYFIFLLNNEVILSQSHIQTINSKNQCVVYQFFRDLAAINKVEFSQMPDYINQKAIYSSIYALVNLVAQKIAKVYEQCASLFKNNLKELTQQIKTSKIMNNFLLFKVFRQIAQHFKKICFQKSAESVFRNCQQDTFEDFFKYLINKFEEIKLFYNSEIFDNDIFQPKQLIFLQKLESNPQIEMGLKQAINSEGKFAIFIKTTSENKQIQRTLQDYILILDEKQHLQLVNCKTLRKRWFIMGDLKTKVKLSVMAKDYILEGQEHFDHLIKDKKQSIQIIPHGQPLEMYTNSNGIVGRTLYMMKQYSGVNAFFLDLSRRAILIKSAEELIHQLPIFGYIILAGTFSIKFYKILTNKLSTNQSKLKDMLGIMIGATTTVGSSLLGAMTGQVLIPIPVFGALIGGVIGGFIGEKGGKHINSWMTKKTFLRIIQYLRQEQIDKTYWVWSEGFYKQLQIKQKQVKKEIPQYMQDFVFATMVAFILICFYESQRLIQYNKEKAKTQKSKTSYEKIKNIKNQRQFQQQLKNISLQQDYSTDFDLMKIIQFLEENNASVYSHFAKFEKSILIFLQKIIS